MVAGADLRVTIDADAAKLERALARASASMLTFEQRIRSTDTAAAQLDQMMSAQRAQALNTLGTGMLAFGAATLAGLGLAAKAAIDWESAWAGVRKTVDGSDAELAALESELRNLTTILPASHREIAGVAEAAGQLGVATGDITSFTRVMVDLGETTNLTASEAATSIAQLMNVMQTAPEDVGRLGAALVELGNNGASTEADIIEMAQRIAGAGQIIGLAESEVLAIANALASVGIEAEAGGTAISTAMTKMASAVAAGGEEVVKFAEVAGMSADQFVTAFETDPARAIQAFVSGLGRIDAAGGNVFATLDELGLGTIRTRDALLRLSGAGDLLSQSLSDGARAWEENTALIEEAGKRYDTAEARIQIAKNALVELAIDVGSVVLPAIATLADSAAAVAGFFADLPGPVKAVATVLGLLVGATALAGGGFLLLAPRIAAARAQMLILARTAPVLYGALATLGQTAGIAAGIAAVGVAAVALFEATKDATPSIEAMTAALLDLNAGISSKAIDDMIAKRDELGDRTMWDNIIGGLVGLGAGNVEAAQTSAELADAFEAVDKSLSSMVSAGSADMAEESLRRLHEEFGRTGESVDDFAQRVAPEYVAALEGVDNQQRVAAESTAPLEDGLATLAEQFGLVGEDAAKAAQEMLDSWSEAASEFVTLTSDMVATVDEYLAALEEQVVAQLSWEANMLAISSRVPAAMLDELARLGPEGAEEVALMAQMTEAELARAVEIWRTRTGEGADAIAQRLAEAQPVLAQIAQRHGQAVADRVAAGMAQNSSSVFEEATRQGVLIDRGVGTNRTRRAPIAVDVTGIGAAERQLNTLARDRATAIRVTVSTGVRVAGFTGQGGTTFQHGTEHAPGGVALVGEEGPELVEIPRGSRVHDAATTEAILRNPSTPLGGFSQGAFSMQNHFEISGRDARVPMLSAALREVARYEAMDLLREIAAQERRGPRA